MKLICINNSPLSFNPFNDSLNRLVVGRQYTGVFNITGDILLEEVKSSHPNGGFDRRHFKKVEKTQAVMMTFEKLKESLPVHAN